MVGSHIGHDCHVGNKVIMANNAVLGGHCQIGDHVFIGGHCAVHQFVRIGESVMVSGYSALSDDVIPFGFVLQPIGRLVGVNVIGMRRRGASKDTIRAVQQAYSLLFEGEGEFASRVDATEAKLGNVSEVAKMIAFIREKRQRPIMLSEVRGRRVDDPD